MKTLKNWKQFNELKTSTYKKAAKKLKDLGFSKRAKNLEDYAQEKLKKSMRVTLSNGVEMDTILMDEPIETSQKYYMDMIISSHGDIVMKVKKKFGKNIKMILKNIWILMNLVKKYYMIMCFTI